MTSLTEKNRLKQQQSDDYLIFLLKVKQLKKAQLIETNKRLAKEKSLQRQNSLNLTSNDQQCSPRQSPGVKNNLTLNAKELSSLILSYYSSLPEGQKKSVEKTLTLSRFKERLPRKTTTSVDNYTQPNGYSTLTSSSKPSQRQGHSRSHSQNNYTSEEYGNWLRARSSCDESTERTISTESSPNPSIEGHGWSLEGSLDNFSSQAALKPLLKSSISSLVTFNDDLPQPSTQLTNGRRNNDLCESKLCIARIDGNYQPELGRTTFDEGYLNLKCHYLSYSPDKMSDQRQKFYCVLRLDDTACARTTLAKRQADRGNCENLNCRSTKKVEFNEQFILDIKDKACFDVVLCQFIDRKQNEQKKKKEKSIQNEIRYYSQRISLNDLVQSQRLNEPSYFRISLDNRSACSGSIDSVASSSGHFDLLLSIVYFKEYSLINQIFSNRKNSKIFSLPLNSEKNKFELVVYKCIDEIEARGLHDPFIYELDTCLTDTKWAILQIERDFFTIIQQLPDINSVANVLKEMLKELQDPIFVNLEIYNSFISLWNRSNANRLEANELFYLIVDFIDLNLEFVNKAIFYSIIQHLRLVCMNNHNFESKQNKLSAIFAKLIFKVHGKIETRTKAIDMEIISFLIRNWKMLETNILKKKRLDN